MIHSYGATLVLTPGAGTDIDLAMARMREMVAAQPGRYFVPAEFENADNPAAQTGVRGGDLGADRRCGACRRRGAGDGWMDQRRGAGAEGPRPCGPRLRRSSRPSAR